ncbi:VP6 [Bluetongue virus]|uniref:VP6 n=1 Tax=Bluetongue virus TaxID=40051 RepID=A0A1I9KZH6_BTV|nr:VP6 [Bluetongue virus]
MSAAILLAPGDVIKRSSEELKQRQIQINLIDWVGSEQGTGERKADSKEENKGGTQHGEEAQSQGGEKKKSGKETEDVNVDGCVHTTVGSGPGAERAGGSAGKNADGRDGATAGRDRIVNGGDGADGTNGGGWVVLTEEIARAIESKYGTRVGVYADEPVAQIIEVERSLQKELGLTREGIAEQTERLRDLRRRERGEHAKRAGERRKQELKKKKKDGDSKGEAQLQQPQESAADGGIVIEGVMSQKKLLSMVGGVERKAKPVGARESAVMLVSNSLNDVNRATAYFTSPTGDPNWKEVAREASKKKNILAYTSAGGDVKTEFLHLIDHL